MDDAAIEEAVKRYLAKLGRRYAPFLIGLVCFALIVTLVPTVDKSGTGDSADLAANGSTTGRRNGSTSGGSSSDGTDTGTDGATAGDQGTATGDGGTSATGGSTATGGGTSSNGGGTSSGGGGGSTSDGGGTASASGVAKSGVQCGPGVKQVPWTAYAPPCVAAFTGSNGGTTSRGVTKDTITFAFREATSAQASAVQAAAGDAAPAPDPQYEADLNTYIDFFNKNFETYGRKVVLKAFKGQGDYIQEDQGNGAPQAQADAQTVANMPAFADATFYLKASEVYQRALATQKVTSTTALGLSQKWFQDRSPYAVSPYLDGTKAGRFMSNVGCQRMSGLPAVFAGDATYQKTTRVFGLITPENPDYVTIGDGITAGLKACGQEIKKTVRYQIDVATFQSQAANLTAQLRAAGVTTVLCYCDPLVPIFLSRSASSQGWRPEWVTTYFGDTGARIIDQDQWSSAITFGNKYPVATQTEAYKVFKLAKPNADPAEQYYALAYEQVLHLFSLIQAAGPRLTPQTFAQGAFSIANTPKGDFGAWGPGNGQYTPFVDSGIIWWDRNATSSFDGKKGAWLDCESGARYKFADPPSGWGPAKTQLHCFGK